MHLLVIFGIALLVFGPKKLPELGKGLGEGIRGFQAAMDPRGEAKPSATAGNAGGSESWESAPWEARISASRRVALNYSVWINFSAFPPLPTAFPPV
jgi:sec-independent protein translocase protein TatA